MDDLTELEGRARTARTDLAAGLDPSPPAIESVLRAVRRRRQRYLGAAVVVVVATVGMALSVDRGGDPKIVTAGPSTTGSDLTEESDDNATNPDDHLVPTDCTDDAAGPVFRTGTDARGDWQFSISGTPPEISTAVTYVDADGAPISSGSATMTAEAWDDLVERGTLGYSGSGPEPGDSHILASGNLPTQAHAIRLRYPDGRTEETCTMGRRLGLPFVSWLADVDLADLPAELVAINAAGHTIAQGDFGSASKSEFGEWLPPTLDLQLDGSVPLPLQPDTGTMTAQRLP